MFSIGDYVKRTDLQNKIDLKILSEQELKFLQESISVSYTHLTLPTKLEV